MLKPRKSNRELRTHHRVQDANVYLTRCAIQRAANITSRDITYVAAGTPCIDQAPRGPPPPGLPGEVGVPEPGFGAGSDPGFEPPPPVRPPMRPVRPSA